MRPNSYLNTRSAISNDSFGSSFMATGFVGSENDYADVQLNLNDLLISHPSATFFMRAKGDSLRDFGILNNDLLVIDRSEQSKHSCLAVVTLNGELLIRQLVFRHNSIWLRDAAGNLSNSSGGDFELWGPIIHVIHTLL